MTTAVLPIPSPKELSRIQAPEAYRRLSLVVKSPLCLHDFQIKPDYLETFRQKVSESEAKLTLNSFLDRRCIGYRKGISSPNTAFEVGSRLSVHLAWGTLSPRTVLQSIDKKRDTIAKDLSSEAKSMCGSLTAFKARLSWRDHFIQRLESEPQMERKALHPSFENLPLGLERSHLRAWLSARTGFPLVDACLRCAQQSGFLNFRMRCMITSVACHALHLD